MRHFFQLNYNCMKKNLLHLVPGIFCFLSFFLQTSRVQAQSWTALGNGPGGNVFALDTFQGKLYAGGYFFKAFGGVGNYIATWDGSKWDSLPGGGMNGKVSALIVYNGNLIAGGTFTMAGNITVNNIAQWNGTTWSAMGTGLNAGVSAFAIYSGNLYASGNAPSGTGQSGSEGLAMWNGSTWTFGSLSAGYGVNGGVMALAVSGSDLYVGGAFNNTIGGVTVTLNYIGDWNGTSWSAMGSGMNSGQVNALASYNGEVYAGGTFTSAGGITANSIASWNGAAWSAVGGGMNSGSVNVLMGANGTLIVGGIFGVAGSTTVNSIAQWNGSTWSAFGTGMDNAVQTLMMYNGHLYAGGDFSNAGGVTAPNVAEWNGTLGINELPAPIKVSVYPNPGKGLFTFKRNSTSFQENEPMLIEICNVLGEKLYRYEISSDETSLDLSDNAPGIYLYKLLTNTGIPVCFGKLVKE
jgi:hypothetical protein